MNKFFFFKVVLSYFDDERRTFFITPDQSGTDEEGVPFSENDLHNTAEFKEFVKKTKADVIDVDYIEYAVEYDPKKSVVLGSPITDESFSALENGGQLEIIDQNQFPIILKKPSKGGGSKNYIFFLIFAAVIVLMVLFISAAKGGLFGDDMSESESSSETESDTGISDGESSETSDESSNSENTHEPTIDTGSGNSDNSDTSGDDSASVSSDDPENSSSDDSSDDTSEDENPESSGELTKPIFNLDRESNMAVTIFFDGEEPAVTFTDPHGKIIVGSEYTADHRSGSVCYYVENAEPGQWLVSCGKPFTVDWQPYGVLPEVGE